MADMERRITSIVFVLALVGTLISALVFKSLLMVIVCLCVQVPAYVWYCASYIPFAQKCIKSCLSSCFGKLKEEGK